MQKQGGHSVFFFCSEYTMSGKIIPSSENCLKRKSFSLKYASLKLSETSDIDSFKLSLLQMRNLK